MKKQIEFLAITVLSIFATLLTISPLFRQRKFSKLRWMRKLSVGDTVCDCRYVHSKITSFEVNRYPPKWIMYIVAQVPGEIGNKLCKLTKATLKKIGLTQVEDKRVTVEDGHSFSIMSCCDPVDPKNHYKHD